MRIHHLNCGSMCPPLGSLINERGLLVCHVLLVEAPGGLVLVDTGMGTDDCDPARTRIHRAFRTLVRPRLERAETALAQVEALGFRAADVRHLVLTHLDLDHAGGISDFPHARVHLHGPELDAALRPRGRDRLRYIQAQWAHGPDWASHRADPGGERWHGFECVRDLPGLPPEILLVPLAGHSRGHAGVAIDGGDGWLLHAGDAYFYHGEMEPEARCTRLLSAFQALDDSDRKTRIANQKRLRELALQHADVRVFCAHDPVELERARAAAGTAVAAQVAS